MEPAVLYPDILYLIFDKMILSFKQTLYQNLEKKIDIIYEEFIDYSGCLERTSISPTTENIFLSMIKNENNYGFIISCKHIYNIFKSYVAQPQYQSKYYFEAEFSTKNIMLIYQIKTSIIFNASMKIIKSYFNYDLICMSIFNSKPEISYSIFKEKYHRKWSGRMYYYDNNSISLFNGWPCDIYINGHINESNIFYKIDYEDSCDKEYLLKLNVDMVGIVSFKNRVNFGNIESFVRYYNGSKPAEEKLVLKFLKGKKEYENHYNFLILMKKVAKSLDNLCEKFEVDAADLNKFLLKDGEK